MLLRIDNIFLTTTNVEDIAKHYSNLTGMPIRRRQVEQPGLMWAELLAGGMEFSFRLADATPSIHEHLVGNFLEQPPGGGATISFEVADTKDVRKQLESRGVKFHGETISCSDGQELISIFEDHAGRPVQLYEPRFGSTEAASVSAVRQASTVSFAYTQNKIQVGSNLRNIANLGLSIAFEEQDLEAAKDFYGRVLELPLEEESESGVAFRLDHALIEFRKSPAAELNSAAAKGGIVVFEVRTLAPAMAMLKSMTSSVSSPLDVGAAVPGARMRGRDLDGNQFEFWERPNVY
jgi:catechol 2,3-dioxygenase-like lactoylglutathione lyase family enzyme